MSPLDKTKAKAGGLKNGDLPFDPTKEGPQEPEVENVDGADQNAKAAAAAEAEAQAKLQKDQEMRKFLADQEAEQER